MPIASSFKNTRSFFTLVLSALLLQGCGNEIDCNSSQVKKDVISIVKSNMSDMSKGDWYNEVLMAISGDPELTNVKTLAYNEQLKQAQCTAKYSFTYNGRLREVDANYELGYLQDKGKVEVKLYIDEVLSKITNIAMVQLPVKNGVQKILDPSSENIKHTIIWKNGIQEGVEELFNPKNGKLIYSANFVNGVKKGKEKHWSDDGSLLLVDIDWIDGQPNGYEKTFDVTGNVILVDLKWKAGKETGLKTIGDFMGRYEQFNLLNGAKNGIHRSYVIIADGKKVLDIENNYKDGKLDGVEKQYSEGQLTQEVTYRDGVEISRKSIPSVEKAAEGLDLLVKKCVQDKTDKFHKENGENSPIDVDMLNGWSINCNR